MDQQTDILERWEVGLALGAVGGLGIFPCRDPGTGEVGLLLTPLEGSSAEALAREVAACDEGSNGSRPRILDRSFSSEVPFLVFAAGSGALLTEQLEQGPCADDELGVLMGGVVDAIMRGRLRNRCHGALAPSVVYVEEGGGFQVFGWGLGWADPSEKRSIDDRLGYLPPEWNRGGADPEA